MISVQVSISILIAPPLIWSVKLDTTIGILNRLLAMLNLIIFALPLLFFTTFLIKWFSTTNTNKHLPPSPPRLPILGNLHQLGTRPHRSLQKLAQRHGELMMLQFGSRPVLIVSSADGAREILKTNDLNFSNRAHFPIFDKLFYKGKDVATAPYGAYWRNVRSICVLQLLSNKKVQSFRGVREEELALLIESVKQSSKLTLPVNLSELFSLLANDVICRVAFGRKYGGDSEGTMKFRKLLGEFMGLLGCFSVGDFIPWLSWVNRVSGLDARVERVSKEFDELLDTIVEAHMVKISTEEDICSEEAEDGKDFVDVLLEVQKTNIPGSSIDRDSIKGVILDMFVGGTDTTSTVLEWAMTELLRHHKVMEKLRNEAAGVANGKQYITESDLDKMPYLKAVIKETLRMYPPIPLGSIRESIQDATIKGYDIAARTMVVVNAWTIGRDPSTWDEPEVFRPDRFMNSSVDFKGQDFQFIPFGYGRRGCPGGSFSMPINELVLANLVHMFEWALPSGVRAEDVSMTECSGIGFRREVPLIAMAVPKSS